MIKCPEDSNNFPSHGLRHNSANKSLRKLYTAIGLCTLFMMVELIGGYLSNSLAIISDAVHLLSDVAGFFTSIVAILISKRSANMKYTFGFQRAQTLGALASVAFVWAITVFLIMEAIERIKNPENIDGKLMFFISLFGVIVNIVLVFSLEHGGHTHAHNHQNSNSNIERDDVENGDTATNTTLTNNQTKDLNLRAAFIHVIGDLIQSIGVLIASCIIWYNKEWRIADPICTLFFSVIVIVSTIFICRDILRILMEGTPKHINLSQICFDLQKIEGILGVHDLHVWTISADNVALTVHVTISSDMTTSSQDQILSKIQEMLCSNYKIHHSTIQIEKEESIHCNPVYCCKK